MRERREDISGLARHFLSRSATELGVEAKRLSEPALASLVAFDFPGNVRQLENICHWLTVMAPAQVVESKDLPRELLEDASLAPQTMSVGVGGGVSAGAPLAPAAPSVGGVDDWLADMAREARRLLEAGQPEVWDSLTRRIEAKLILTALEVTRGRRIEAAQRLGIGRNTITRKIQELGLEP